MPKSDITNNKLSKLVSIEMVGTILVMAFTIGVTYATLATAQDEAEQKIIEIDKEQKIIKDVVREIQTDTAIMRNEQQHIKEDMKEQKQDIKRVLKILERNGNRSTQ